MFSRIRKRHVTKGGRNSLPDKLWWLRSLRCVTCGAFGPEAHHDRHFGSRATDEKTVPICTSCHRTGPESLHALGRRRFWARHHIDIDLLCQWYHKRYLDWKAGAA